MCIRDRTGIHLRFDNAMAHRIEAGADMFLMPSRYEPCGLNQLYSLKYGTVPVVRATGGLKDTIIDYNDKTARTGQATGFSFEPYDADALLETLKRAVALFDDKETWKGLMVNGMKQDWSWKRAAREYIDLYNWALGRLQRSNTPDTGARAVWEKTETGR